MHEVDAHGVVPANREVLVAGVELERACDLRQRQRCGDRDPQNAALQHDARGRAGHTISHSEFPQLA